MPGLLRVVLPLCLAVPLLVGAAFAVDLELKKATHEPRGRIDAMPTWGKAWSSPAPGAGTPPDTCS